MSTEVIGAYSAAITIDGANHYLLIQPGNSSTAYNKINRNVFLGVTGQPADISSSQTLTNKTIGITNTVIVSDTLFTIQDNSDNTKQAQFQLSGLTTGTTRTYTLPNVTDTLVSLTATQTLTNKTITAPAITGGTIDNTTITVDSIAGHSTSTIVTVANMQISNGVINSANAVTATSIATGAVQPQALQSGTGSGWALQTWTPSWTNLTVGNGTVTAKYVQTGKWVQCKLTLAFGSSTSVTGSVTFTIPITAVSISASMPVGQSVAVIPSSQYNGYVTLSSTTVATPFSYVVSSTHILPEAWDATHPAAFGATTIYTAVFAYESA